MNAKIFNPNPQKKPRKQKTGQERREFRVPEEVVLQVIQEGMTGMDERTADLFLTVLDGRNGSTRFDAHWDETGLVVVAEDTPDLLDSIQSCLDQMAGE
jgi:hypothetical protein